MVLRDIEAGLPLLDKLGILLRPVRGEDGKIDLLVWEAALQMPTDSNWARALFKPKVFFGRDYPAFPPKVKMPAEFFHSNCYLSGNVDPCKDFAKDSADLPCSALLQYYGAVLDLTLVRSARYEQYCQLPAALRLPTLLAADQQQLAYENLEDPAQLEPYQMAKYATLSFQIAAVTASLRHGFSQEVFGCPCSSVIRKEPDEYSNRVRRIVPTMLPAPNDVEDLVEALQRAEYRKKTR